MSKHIKIRFGAAPHRNNNSDDIVQLKQALESLDYYKVPEYGITPYADRSIFDSIFQFQKDIGLTTDRIVNPGGETERAIDQLIQISGRSPILRCRICEQPHGGAYGDVCKDCYDKGLGGSAPERI